MQDEADRLSFQFLAVQFDFALGVDDFGCVKLLNFCQAHNSINQRHSVLEWLALTAFMVNA
ncbi:hypothetical protein D3C80_1589750 [compost metagenome]